MPKRSSKMPSPPAGSARTEDMAGTAIYLASRAGDYVMGSAP